MDNARTPEEIERDIERERANLTGTIDSLQDRFSMDGVMNQASDYLKENGGEIANNIGATVKQNPLGVALVGAGLAWLMLGKGQQTSVNAGSSRGYQPTDRTGADEVDVKLGRKRTAYDDAAFDRASAREANAPYLKAAHADTDWMYDDDDDDSYDVHERSIWEGAKAYAADAAENAKAAGSDAASALNSAKDNAAAGVATAKGKAASAADAASGSISDSATSASSAVKNAAGSMQAAASDTAAQAKARADRLRTRLSKGTEDLSEAARERVVKARYAALRAKETAQAKGSAAIDQSAETYNRQPLAFGALAFAIGAAAAATLPRTRVEDKAVGDKSDQLMARAQYILDEEKRKLSEVATAARNEAEDIVSEAKSNVKSALPDADAVAEVAGEKAKSAAKRVSDRAASEADKQNLGKTVKVS